MKVGDKVKMSDKNLNHTKTDICAYAGMEGTVTEIYEDGAFVLDCKTCVLVVPMKNGRGINIDGVWIEIEGKTIFHSRVKKQRNTILNKIQILHRIIIYKFMLKHISDDMLFLCRLLELYYAKNVIVALFSEMNLTDLTEVVELRELCGECWWSVQPKKGLDKRIDVLNKAIDNAKLKLYAKYR
jgi:hypothetical protein